MPSLYFSTEHDIHTPGPVFLLTLIELLLWFIQPLLTCPHSEVPQHGHIKVVCRTVSVCRIKE